LHCHEHVTVVIVCAVEFFTHEDVDLQKRYGFKAHVFHADGFNNKKEYEAKHGSDLFITVS